MTWPPLTFAGTLPLGSRISYQPPGWFSIMKITLLMFSCASAHVYFSNYGTLYAYPILLKRLFQHGTATGHLTLITWCCNKWWMTMLPKSLENILVTISLVHRCNANSINVWTECIMYHNYYQIQVNVGSTCVQKHYQVWVHYFHLRWVFTQDLGSFPYKFHIL